MVDSGDTITAQEWQHIFPCARCICHIADNGWDRMATKTWSSILGTLQQLPGFQKFHFNCPKPFADTHMPVQYEVQGFTCFFVKDNRKARKM